MLSFKTLIKYQKKKERKEKKQQKDIIFLGEL